MFNLICLVACYLVGIGAEPSCSRFHYEEKTLEKLVRLEFQMEQYKEEMKLFKKEKSDFFTKAQEYLNIEKEQIQAKMFNLSSEVQQHVTLNQQRMDTALQTELQKINTFKDQLMTPTIHFRAKKVVDKSPSQSQTILFSDVLSNIGNAYDLATGIFTTPVSGTYLFTTQFCLKAGGNYWITDIVVDEITQQRSTFREATYIGHNCHSSDAIVHLQRGNRVCVKYIYTNTGTDDLLLGGEEWRWDTFSGTIIYV